MAHDESKPDWEPLEPEEHEAQIDALLELLAPKRPARVLDLGCGSGRVLIPLAQAGHELVGVDSDPDALAACIQAFASAGLAADSVRLAEADYTETLPVDGPFDAVVCLGHNFMAVVEPAGALHLLNNVIPLLKPDGRFVIDNIPGEFWPRVTEGDWVSGVNDEGTMQLVWSEDDNVFALRTGEEIDEEDDRLHETETRYRLWTMGELRLLASAAGLTPPHTDPPKPLISFGLA